MSVQPGSDAHFERLAIRMIHKVCPIKNTHTDLAADEHCPQCGLDGSDHARFIVGTVGKPGTKLASDEGDQDG